MRWRLEKKRVLQKQIVMERSVLQSRRSTMRVIMEFMSSSTKIFLGVAICLWLACGTAIASRTQLVFDYSTLPLVTPPYELFAAPASAMVALGGVLVCVGWMLFAGKQPVESSSIVENLFPSGALNFAITHPSFHFIPLRAN